MNHFVQAILKAHYLSFSPTSGTYVTRAILSVTKMLKSAPPWIEVSSPMAACVSHGATEFALQQLREVGCVLIRCKGKQGTGIPLQLPHQPQAAENHVTVILHRITRNLILVHRSLSCK